MKKEVNAIGDICPIPLVKAKEAIKELNGAGVVEVLVDNEIAVQNLTKMAQQKGYGCADPVNPVSAHIRGKNSNDDGCDYDARCIYLCKSCDKNKPHIVKIIPISFFILMDSCKIRKDVNAVMTGTK